MASQDIPVDILHLGLPDEFIDHAEPAQQRSQAGLDSRAIAIAIRARLAHTTGTELPVIQAPADILKTI